MDINETPYGASAPPNKPKNKKDEDKNPSSTLVVGGEEDEDGDDEGDDEGYTDIDSTSSREDEEKPFFKKPAFLGAVVVIGIVVIGFIAYSVFKPEPEPPPAPEEIAEVDPSVQMKDNLYQIGIGKESLNEKRIYEQGNIESDDFRKDFTNSGGAEQYALPIDIVTVTDSVAYIKHRTVTGDGMEVYWVDATYKSKKTVFTIPYYIWQTLSTEGVMDVVVEVITDANDNVYIGSITALPPTEGN